MLGLFTQAFLSRTGLALGELPLIIGGLSGLKRATPKLSLGFTTSLLEAHYPPISSSKSMFRWVHPRKLLTPDFNPPVPVALRVRYSTFGPRTQYLVIQVKLFPRDPLPTAGASAASPNLLCVQALDAKEIRRPEIRRPADGNSVVVADVIRGKPRALDQPRARSHCISIIQGPCHLAYRFCSVQVN